MSGISCEVGEGDLAMDVGAGLRGVSSSSSDESTIRRAWPDGLDVPAFRIGMVSSSIETVAANGWRAIGGGEMGRIEIP